MAEPDYRQQPVRILLHVFALGVSHGRVASTSTGACIDRRKVGSRLAMLETTRTRIGTRSGKPATILDVVSRRHEVAQTPKRQRNWLAERSCSEHMQMLSILVDVRRHKSLEPRAEDVCEGQSHHGCEIWRLLNE